jgi:hypothetical protein
MILPLGIYHLELLRDFVPERDSNGCMKVVVAAARALGKLMQTEFANYPIIRVMATLVLERPLIAIQEHPQDRTTIQHGMF